jgi:hypothetical protein
MAKTSGAGGDGGAGIGGTVEVGTTGGTINVTNEAGLTTAAYGRGGRVDKAVR